MMRQGRSRAAFSVLAAGAGLVLSIVSVQAQTPYDGIWHVTIHTKNGSCEPTASYPLTVTDGVVSAAGADVNGKVGREGVVRVSIQGVNANGQLSGQQGSGKWSGAANGVPCSGRWVASRQ
jgi:hypothetical protein